MREIEYRGIHPNLKQFITGLPAYGLDGELNMLQDGPDTYYDILPETVGQFIGLKDKNGKKIFEGDIVEAKFRSGYSNHFVDVEQLREVKYNAQKACWSPFDHCHMWVDDDGQPTAIEVIGNTYENADLLKD